MKNVVYIFFILIIVSCNNHRKMKSENSAVEFEDVITGNKTLESNKFENLSTQKFNDYIDLLKLKDKHPEFKADIIEQLQSISKDSLIHIRDASNFLVKNVRQENGIEHISDSVQKIKLVYDVVLDGRKIEDSVFALITTKVVVIDNKETVSHKVKLLKQ